MTRKGQLEDDISKALMKFEKEYLGRGPQEVKTFIIEDQIFIRLKGVLTPAEQHLAHSHEGKILIKKIRTQLLEDSRPLLEKMIQEFTGQKVISLHTDISTVTGERILVFTLEANLEALVD
ncbi:hypothetical protein MGLY_31860 [Neomoorella glycerini]|uniref:Na+-translocating membrane potential-generating system MpsC domain-containing protein n=1 Tax=Neomoorella glycerini TaxID=55779 RepID=A0A6I5ZV64_9FIRM|nr:DUF2294 domain-containing protein [Moorella glycerini]QGP93764.1 hypothetical protein MGLY_31860 [Moorella glycerini]